MALGLYLIFEFQEVYTILALSISTTMVQQTCKYNNVFTLLSEGAADYVKCSVETVMKIHRKEPAGDILVFLTGVEEVDNCVSYLKEEAASLKKNEGCLMLLVVLLLLHLMPFDYQCYRRFCILHCIFVICNQVSSPYLVLLLHEIQDFGITYREQNIRCSTLCKTQAVTLRNLPILCTQMLLSFFPGNITIQP